MQKGAVERVWVDSEKNCFVLDETYGGGVDKKCCGKSEGEQNKLIKFFDLFEIHVHNILLLFSYKHFSQLINICNLQFFFQSFSDDVESEISIINIRKNYDPGIF